MSLLKVYEYEYSYNKTISSPLESHKNPNGEVRRTKENIKPLQGFARVNDAIYTAGSTQQFIYTIRHGKAHHNALSSEYTKPIAWRFLGRLRNTFDPGLTAEGVRDAQHAGQLLRGLIQQEGAPRPVTVYTSPLRRCVQTAMYTIAELRLNQAVTLHVKEGLREWKGFDHNHEADRRDVTPNIVKLFKDLKRKLNVDVRLKVDGQQDKVDDTVMRETYVDVDRRIRRVLDDILGSGNSSSSTGGGGGGGGGDANCAMLVLHNRSNKSVLRVMGHTQDEVHRLDMENCAVLGYLVRRKRLDLTAAARRVTAEETQRVKDRELAEAEKKHRHELAARDIAEYGRTGDTKLWTLRDYLARWAESGDPEAGKALEDLYTLAPKLETNGGVGGSTTISAATATTTTTTTTTATHPY